MLEVINTFLFKKLKSLILETENMLHVAGSLGYN